MPQEPFDIDTWAAAAVREMLVRVMRMVATEYVRRIGELD
jgi:hypothetical protein